MKRHFYLILTTYCLLALAGPMSSEDAPVPAKQRVTHVATALNHLSVLEFQEPVTLVASAGPDFQIERQDNKVFIKPLKSGPSTNLFVWTSSGRFSYELDPAGEVKDMNFAIDNVVSPVKPALATQTDLDQVADVLLTRAFLGSEPIDSSSIPVPKNGVMIRIEEVLRTKNSLYVHYTVENHSKQPYWLPSPTAYELIPEGSAVSMTGLQKHQLEAQTIRKLRDVKRVALPIAHAEASPDNLSIAGKSSGVVAIRQDFKSPTVLQIVFGSGIEAVVVL